MHYLFTVRPNVAVSSLEFVLAEEIRGDQLLQVYTRRQFKWPEAVRDVLRRIVTSPNVPVAAWAGCCEWGLGSFPDEFENLLIGEIRRLSSTAGNEQRERLISACAVLFGVGRGDPWPIVSTTLYQNPSLSTELFQRIAGMPNENSFLQRMSDVSLGELYVWIGRQYPDPDLGSARGFGVGGPDFTIRILRDAAFFAMRERGNKDVFDYVVHAFPENAWIEQHRPALVEASYHRMWTARDPAALLRLSAERSIPFHLSTRGFYLIQTLTCIFSIGLALALDSWVPRSLRVVAFLSVFVILFGFSSVWLWSERTARLGRPG